MGRARMVRIDENLIVVIKQMQKKLERMNNEPISFADASRALALTHLGIEIPQDPKELKNRLAIIA